MTGNSLLAEFKFFNNVVAQSLEMIAQKGEVLELQAGDVVFRFLTSRRNISTVF